MKHFFKPKFTFQNIQNLSRVLSRDDASMVYRGIKKEFDFFSGKIQKNVPVCPDYSYCAYIQYIYIVYQTKSRVGQSGPASSIGRCDKMAASSIGRCDKFPVR